MRISGGLAATSALFLGAALAAGGIGALSAATAAPAGDAAAGKTIFVRCAMCHSVKPGVNQLGPSLAGVVGRKAGSVAGYSYSPAMKASGRVWNPAALDAYLAGPAKAIPGNKMAFAGLPNPQDRANVIAYLKSPK